MRPVELANENKKKVKPQLERYKFCAHELAVSALLAQLLRLFMWCAGCLWSTILPVVPSLVSLISFSLIFNVFFIFVGFCIKKIICPRQRCPSCTL